MKTITYIMALISVALLLCLSVSASLASTSQISPGLEVISASAGMTGLFRCLPPEGRFLRDGAFAAG